MPSVEEELRRVVPIVEAIRREAGSDLVISIDTRRSEVFKQAHAAGADLLNDVSAGLFDPAMRPMMKQLGASGMYMHMRGSIGSMDDMTQYRDLIDDVGTEMGNIATQLLDLGIPRWRIALDCGLGFSKTTKQCFELLRHFSKLREMIPRGVPEVIGFSRKRFLGMALGHPVFVPVEGKPLDVTRPEMHRERIMGGSAITAWAASNCVEFVRTHDPQEARCCRDVTLQLLHGGGFPVEQRKDGSI